MIPRDFQRDLRKQLADGKSFDEALSQIRIQGASILESIMAVQKFRGCDLAEAKKLVHFSNTWADVRQRNEDFHRELAQAANESSSRPFSNVSKARSTDRSLHACPCCGSRTLLERGGYELCPVCYWEDDGQDSHDADEIRGGPNGELSLTRARENYRQIGASDPKFLNAVRKPLAGER